MDAIKNILTKGFSQDVRNYSVELMVEWLNTIIPNEWLPKGHEYGDNLNFLEVLMLQGQWSVVEKLYDAIVLQPKRGKALDLPFPSEKVRKDTRRNLAAELNTQGQISGKMSFLMHLFSGDDIIAMMEFYDDIHENVLENLYLAIEFGHPPKTEITADFLSEIQRYEFQDIIYMVEYCFIYDVADSELKHDIVSAMLSSFEQRSITMYDQVGEDDSLPIFAGALIKGTVKDVIIIENEGNYVAFNKSDFPDVTYEGDHAFNVPTNYLTASPDYQSAYAGW
jgi:hypothetical protein